MAMYDPEYGPEKHGSRKEPADKIDEYCGLLFLEISFASEPDEGLVIPPGGRHFFSSQDALFSRDVLDHTGTQTLLGVVLRDGQVPIQICLETLPDTTRARGYYVGVSGDLERDDGLLEITQFDSGVSVCNRSEKPVIWVNNANRSVVEAVAGTFPVRLLGLPLL